MTCDGCWYCVSAFTRVRDRFYYCQNPKSDFLTLEVEKSFECPAFSDMNLPDKEADTKIHDREWAIKVNRMREDQFMIGTHG